jgi:hypothetical protein
MDFFNYQSVQTCFLYYFPPKNRTGTEKINYKIFSTHFIFASLMKVAIATLICFLLIIN